MSERDELARLLFITDNHSPDAERDWVHLQPQTKYLSGYYAEADAILAAGYRKVTNLDASAVERVANVLIEDGAFGVPWEDASEEARDEAMDKARVLLEAAGHVTPRTINSAEELDALPEGTQIVDQCERLTLEETSIQYLEWVDRHGNACHVELPATILEQP